jgi:hypothetical protein
MPYFLHLDGSDPATGSPYTSRASAHTALTALPSDPKHVVTFVISEDERIEWRTREYQRFSDSVYALPPWIEFRAELWRPSVAGRTDADCDYRYPKLAHHFAHLSLKTPGCIAYTPSDEHGYQDRQVTIKVGRYLEEYGRDYFSTEQIAAFVDTVKGYTSDLQLARTPSDIVSVYRNGPESCMSHATGDYSCGEHHPVEVYGNSDLAVAYLGTLDDVSARCLVWPEKKLHSRIYGDTTLRNVLGSQGYTLEKMDHNYGVFHGAKIRAISLGRERYVMPYLDCAIGVSLDRGAKTFTLHGDDDSPDNGYDTDSTNGVGTPKHSNRCEHCGERCDEDTSYCESCDDDRICCTRCDENYFDSGDGDYVGGDWYCDGCIDRHYQHSCDGCSDTWTEIDPESSYCPECRDHYRACDECDDQFDARGCDDPNHDKCDSCYAPDDGDGIPEDAPDEDAPHVTVNTSDSARFSHQFPTVDTGVITVNFDGVRRPVNVILLTGCLAVHRKIETSAEFPEYTVSHVLTGLIVTRGDWDHVVRVATVLSTPGIDWNFRDRYDAPSTLRDLVLHVREHLALPDTFTPAIAAEEVTPCAR